MKNVYFTFGSSTEFPYQNTYLIVKADRLQDAMDTFRKHYPDRNKGVVNCAFWYTEEQWQAMNMKEHYPDGPIEIIESERKEFERFMDALPNCDTVKVILTGCGEDTFATKDIYESIRALINYSIHWCPFKDRTDIDFDSECVGFGETECMACILRNICYLNDASNFRPNFGSDVNEKVKKERRNA